MALWDDFVNTIRRSVDQVNPWDGGRNWNTLDGEIARKKKEEEERRRQQAAATPAPNFQRPAGMQTLLNTNKNPNTTPKTMEFNFERDGGRPDATPQDKMRLVDNQPRTFGANSGATPGQLQMPDEFKTPQQRQLEQVIANKNARLGKDGTVIDNRPFPARVPNDQFAKANEALKAGTTIKDVGNYWKSDADALRAELMKPNPDKARVQGLTQSINNRKGEIAKMSTQMSRDEQDEFAKKQMEARGGKFQSNQNKVGDFLGGVVAAPFGLVTKPAGTTAYLTNQDAFDTSVADMDRRYRAGEITRARLEQELRDLQGGMITPLYKNKEIKVGDSGLEFMDGGEKLANFAGNVIQQGVDSYVGGGTAVKSALTGGKEVAQLGVKEILKQSMKQGVKESAVTGTLQTGADALKGQLSPEGILLNYGVDSVLNIGGEATGKFAKKYATNQRVKDTTEQLNRALRENGTLDTISEAEVRTMMEKEISEQLDTAAKQIREKEAAVQPQQTLPEASKLPDEQIPNSLEQNVTEPPTKPRSTQSIADLMPGLVGRDPNAVKPEFKPADFGVQDSTYNRLKNQYGEQAAQNILTRSQDATNIRNMDAFVTAEAKKAYGTKSNDQINAEVQQGQAKREEFNMQPGEAQTRQTVTLDDGRVVDANTGEYVDAPVTPQVENRGVIQVVNNQNGTKEYIKPGDVDYEAAVQNIDNNRVANGDANDGIAGVTQDNGDIYHVTARTPEEMEARGFTQRQTQTTTDTVPTAQLGTIADTFYQSKKGNESIKFRDVEALGKQISDTIEQSFKAANSDFPTVARKIQEAQASGAKTLDDVDLTPQEKSLWLGVEAEMDYVRRRASIGRKEISQGDQGELYLPHQAPGTFELRENLLAGFRDVKPGNEFRRKSGDAALGLDDIDYSPEVVGQYVTRYADTKLLNEERIARAVEKNNPDVDPKQINEATKQIIALQEKVNSVKTKITLGGAGKKVIASKGGAVDFAAEMSKVGKTLGREQVDVVGTPKGFTNGERLNSVYVGDKTLADAIGLNQYRDAGTFAGTQVREAAGDREVLLGQVYERLTTQYNLPEDDVARMLDSIERVKADVPENVMHAKIAATYSTAAKQQMMEQLQNLDIKNPKIRKDVSDLANQITREGSIEQQLSAKLIQNTLRTTNALFRKLNVSSALNELSDLTSFTSVFGNDMAVGLAKPNYSLVKTYNLGEIDPAIEPFIRQVSEGGSVKNVASKINDATNLYKFVEHYKTASFLTAAERHYTKKGLTGDALTSKIIDDYRKLALPQDAFTKTFLNDYPLYTQYMSWSARNMQKEYRLATGKIDAGTLGDKSDAARIARNLYANLPAKTIFWLSSNGLKGTALMTAFGLTDFTGLTSQDYSGIAEEDKSLYDRTTQFTNISTVMSLINSVVQGVEKEQLKEKYKDADYNPYETSSVGATVFNTFTPQVIKNTMGGNDLNSKGYSENAAGRVQYEAPDDIYNQIKSFVFGKNQTANAREYSGRENLVDRMAEGVNPVQAVTDMAREQLGLKETDYNRPLTDVYSEAYKNADADGRTKMLEGGRQFNKYLDDMKKNSPEDYNRYIGALDGNHVQPEYWKAIAGDNLKVFKMIGDRKKQMSKDMGTAYDPLYDLPDDQAKSVLQLKSAPTGDDIALRNALGKEGWYKDYKAKIAAYYDNKEPASDAEFKETERVKQWNALDDQLQSFYYDKSSKEVPAWAEKYPLVYQSKKLEYGSPESKAFFKANYDAYAAQKEAMEKSQLDVINAMRKIEGHPPMGWEQYQQATEFADTDGDSKKSGGGYGSGGGSKDGYVSVKTASFGRSGASGYTPVSTAKVKKVARKARVRSGVKGGKITLKREKTL